MTSTFEELLLSQQSRMCARGVNYHVTMGIQSVKTISITMVKPFLYQFVVCTVSAKHLRHQLKGSDKISGHSRNFYNAANKQVGSG